MNVCWECDRIARDVYGHEPGCSMPTAGEAHPGYAESGELYTATLSCGHEVFPLYRRVRVGEYISCWNGDPGRCQAQRRIASIRPGRPSGIRLKSSAEKVASRAASPYTSALKKSERSKEEHMPRAPRAAAPEPEVEDEALDYTVYADKTITPTMSDFADWIVEEVYAGDEAAFRKADSERIVALAGTLRMEFQKSELNKTRREERRAAREAEVAEPAEPKTARAKPAAKATVPPPARRGRAAAAAAAEPTKPAARSPRRGRAAAAAY
jgi:hypothetical protein